eukprot:3158093-Alexandrium_andersonii.AAC.1
MARQHDGRGHKGIYEFAGAGRRNAGRASLRELLGQTEDLTSSQLTLEEIDAQARVRRDAHSKAGPATLHLFVPTMEDTRVLTGPLG